MSGLDNTVNGDWPDCISAFAHSTVDDCETSLRANGRPSSDLYYSQKMTTDLTILRHWPIGVGLAHVGVSQ